MKREIAENERRTIKMRLALFFLIICLWLPIKGGAVMVASDTPNANTTEPSGDQGWSSMGIYNGAGAAYLGAGWFLTARHLGTVSTVKFGGVNYSINGTSWTSITNPDATIADLRLFQVADPSAISAPGSQINTSSISLGTAVTMIGYGRDVSNVTTNKVGQRYQIKYYESTTSQMKWGPNEISGSQADYTELSYKTSVLETTLFSGLAQGLDKDSGGGVFVYDSGSNSYLLAGIMIGALRYQDANGIYAFTDTGSISSNSKTYIADISVYKDQIQNTIPEPSVALMMGFFAFGSLVYRRHRRAFQ